MAGGDRLLGYGHDRMGSVRFLYCLDHDYTEDIDVYGPYGSTPPSDDSTMSVGSATTETRRCRVVQFIAYSGFERSMAMADLPIERRARNFFAGPYRNSMVAFMVARTKKGLRRIDATPCYF